MQFNRCICCVRRYLEEMGLVEREAEMQELNAPRPGRSRDLFGVQLEVRFNEQLTHSAETRTKDYINCAIKLIPTFGEVSKIETRSKKKSERNLIRDLRYPWRGREYIRSGIGCPFTREHADWLQWSLLPAILV